MFELGAFTAQLVRRPRQVSALSPSSRALCRLMAAQIPVTAVSVAEFGPGTGNVTREILARGILADNLTLLEINPAFCQMLRRAHPTVDVVNEPAQHLPACRTEPVDAVISGLPLLSMSAALQEAIVSAAFSRLSADGVYIQFTYGPVSPLRDGIARKLGLIHTRTRRVWLNLPPATVYVYRRALSIELPRTSP